MTHILVVGGAGYIGSHMVLALRDAGMRVTVLDNLSHGHRDAVAQVPCVVGDINDAHFLDQLFASERFSAVMHFAALIEVAQSVQEPARYYMNNVLGTQCLLQAMIAHDVQQLIFSSTAAVYGMPTSMPMTETHPLLPVNPYGETKRQAEALIQTAAATSPLRYMILRYFNATGADPAGRAGERHDPESHLIPILLEVAAKQRRAVNIHGLDYATADGACIRDYVHVSDLCQAHLLALTALSHGNGNQIYNVGTGVGTSVLQVLHAVEEVTGCKIPRTVGGRRPGDPSTLVADATQIQTTLGWSPRYRDIRTMIAHAWAFKQQRQQQHQFVMPA